MQFLEPTDMFTYAINEDIRCVTDPCNCVGVSGKGISKQVMQRWPSLEARYKSACTKGLKPGKLCLLTQSHDLDVLLFPTKDHWRNDSRLEWVEAGLIKLTQGWEARDFTSLVLPPLGCGNGKLAWQDVKKLMERYLIDLDVHCIGQ